MGANQKSSPDSSVSSPASTAAYTTAVTASTSTAPSSSVTRVVVSLRDRPSPTPQVCKFFGGSNQGSDFLVF